MTFAHRAALSLLVFGLLGLSGNGDVTSSGSFEPTSGPWVAPMVPPDTLQASAEAGTPLLLSLPAELNGRVVDSYTLLRGPSLSGVAGRSFTWIPEGTEPGIHEVLLRTQVPDAAPDTLLLRINLQP